MNDFDALLAELSPLAKAMKPDAEGDAKIVAAAEEAGADVPEPEADEDDGKPGASDGEASDADEDEDAPLGKSFAVTMPDGSVQEAYDGTEMFKALRAEMDAALLRADDHAAALEAAQAELTKSLTVSVTMLGVVRGQGALIKSLEARVATLSGQGAGRKASLTLHEKQSGTPTAPDAPDGPAILAKAMTAYAAGTFASSDIARIEAHQARGLPVPADIVARLAV